MEVTNKQTNKAKQENMGKLLTNYKTDGIKILDPKKQKTSKQGNMGKLLTNYKTDGIKILDPKKTKNKQTWKLAQTGNQL